MHLLAGKSLAVLLISASSVFAMNSVFSLPSVLEKPAIPAQESAPAPAAPVPPGSESGLISNFDDGTASVKFGAGWMISTDQFVGGTSTAEMKVIEGGANKTKNALEISGTVNAGFQYPWAGVMFSPGAAPFAPANLSSKKAIHFWARGDSRTYRVMVFTSSGGRIPAMKTFNVTSEWKEFTLPFSDFNGTDARDLQAILFASSMDPGPFKFAIDEVRFD